MLKFFRPGVTKDNNNLQQSYMKALWSMQSCPVIQRSWTFLRQWTLIGSLNYDQFGCLERTLSSHMRPVHIRRNEHNYTSYISLISSNTNLLLFFIFLQAPLKSRFPASLEQEAQGLMRLLCISWSSWMFLPIFSRPYGTPQVVATTCFPAPTYYQVKPRQNKKCWLLLSCASNRTNTLRTRWNS